MAFDLRIGDCREGSLTKMASWIRTRRSLPRLPTSKSAALPSLADTMTDQELNQRLGRVMLWLVTAASIAVGFIK